MENQAGPPGKNRLGGTKQQAGRKLGNTLTPVEVFIWNPTDPLVSRYNTNNSYNLLVITVCQDFHIPISPLHNDFVISKVTFISEKEIEFWRCLSNLSQTI